MKINDDTEYEKAKHLLELMKKDFKHMEKRILDYENTKPPRFTTLTHVKDFVEYNAQQGSLFEYGGTTYEVGDLDELVSEYGYEDIFDTLHSAKSLSILLDNLGIIRPIKL